MKKLIYGIMIIIAVFGVQKIYDRSMPVKESKPVVSEVIDDVFKQEGINENECIIDGYYYYGSMYLSDDGCHEILDKLAENLGVSEYEYSRNRTKSGYLAVLKKEGGVSSLTINLITVECEEGESIISQQQYISINLAVNNSVESGFYYRRRIGKGIEDLYKENDGDDTDKKNEDREYRDYVKNLNISVKGKIYGVADIERQKNIAGRFLEKVEADKVFDNVNRDRDMEMYSLYGYTDAIDDYVAVGNEKINVNVVFNYNEEENATYVHFGSPIINYDY